ncbi:sensor histidine kinase [Paenibacillus sambharensis]|uniref:Sensor histidine kinase n=1 Tax=Paenibacillus sambharensis TaxID=1803190 RepID=A0A2W1LRG2_9BACL|nr:sensor histidine kinase [Paenibacillus sambharensis]PZD94411.1 sensor histidine kinase [Paenibacillus sambharensis]
MRNNPLALNNWPIRYKLILHFILISILPAATIGGLIAWATDTIIGKQVNSQTARLIGSVSQSLDFYAQNLQNHTYFISFNPSIIRFLEEGEAALEQGNERYETKKFLQGFTTLYPEIAGIMVVGAHGDYISNEMYARTSRSLTEEQWYKEAVAAKGIFKMIGHPSERNVITHVNYRDDEVVSVVRAILDPERQVPLGVVLIDLKLRVIAETVKDVRLGKSGYLMVVDDKGDSIYAPRYSVAASLDKDQLKDMSGTFAEKIGDRSFQFIYARSPFTNWATVGVFDVRESAAEVRQINLFLLIFVFAACLLGITASYYLSYSISRPITQLASTMRKVEEGNLTIRYPGTRQDEVGILGRSFNGMLTQINRLLEQVGEEQRQKREAELRSLQAHIKPHFLYNTLDTIQWLARKDGAAQAAEVVESLSRLFRIGLSKGRELILLQDELAHIRSYLEIQKTRYKDKLSYSIDSEPQSSHLLVTKLTLQPIVENAIYHGIKERRGPGMVRIRAAVKGKSLLLVVEDDGAGMDAAALQSLRTQLDRAGKLERRQSHGEPAQEGTGGYGLVNIQERIRLAFGWDYGIEVESEPGKGTAVSIRHPLLEEGRGED